MFCSIWDESVWYFDLVNSRSSDDKTNNDKHQEGIACPSYTLQTERPIMGWTMTPSLYRPTINTQPLPTPTANWQNASLPQLVATPTPLACSQLRTLQPFRPTQPSRLKNPWTIHHHQRWPTAKISEARAGLSRKTKGRDPSFEETNGRGENGMRHAGLAKGYLLGGC